MEEISKQDITLTEEERKEAVVAIFELLKKYEKENEEPCWQRFSRRTFEYLMLIAVVIFMFMGAVSEILTALNITL